MLCVPLRYKDGDVIGVVYVDNRLVAGIFTERELNLMMAFANTAAVAIANARMYMRAEQILAEDHPGQGINGQHLFLSRQRHHRHRLE